MKPGDGASISPIPGGLFRPRPHPVVATSLNNLATLYVDQGRYAEAEPLLKRALGIMEKTAPNHPNLATLLDNLAELYTNMGRDDEAEKLLARAKRIRAKQ